MKSFFTGVCTALITPFYEGKISFSCLEKLVIQQIKAKVTAIIIAGSTGEGTLLNESEYETLVKFLVQFTQGSIPIVGTCNTQSGKIALKTIESLQNWGVKGIMCTCPPYVLPSQEGMYEYFRALSIESSVPIMLYNIPKRTGIELHLDTIKKLQELENIEAIKDSTYDLSRILQIKNTNESKLKILCANDVDAVAFYANGADGIVSVASNIAPKAIKCIQDYCANNQFQLGLKEHKKLLPLYNLLSYCGNPSSIKYCLYLNGVIKSSELRLPLLCPSQKNKQYIKEQFKTLQHLLN